MMTNEILQIVFSGVVALSTVVYSILTWRLVSETKLIREFQITPDVNVFFERSEADASFIHIVFKNSGLGYAKNVTFEIFKDFGYYDSEIFKLANKGIIKKGIDNFYSNQSYKFFFTDLSQNNEQKKLDNLIIKTTFYNLNNRKFEKEINLSLSELTGISIMTPPDSYVGRISYELSEIKKILKK